MFWNIKNEDLDKRLDVFLAEQAGFFSRSAWQKIIRAGGVRVNGRKKSVHYFLKEGDVVVSEEKRAQEEIKLNTGNFLLEEPRIIFEDIDYLIVNKPPFLLTHGNGQGDKLTLADWLTERYPGLKKLGAQGRPGIVHRLDKNVSGLLVVARNEPMFLFLKEQFQKRMVDKEYVALVYGEVKKDQGEIKTPIGRSKLSGMMVAMSDKNRKERNVRPALTRYEVLQRFKNYTLIRVSIMTGRTHQIRAHLSSIGNAIVGDELYLTRDARGLLTKKPLKRLWLHAQRLSFLSREGVRVTFEAQLPEELLSFLADLKN